MKKKIEIRTERFYKKPGGKMYWDVYFRGSKHLVTVRDIQTDSEAAAVKAAVSAIKAVSEDEVCA